MSHFYGIVNGTGKTAGTRRGHKSTGLTTTAASWQGAIQVTLTHDLKTGLDMAHVQFTPWKGQGKRELLYDGPIGQKG